MAIGVKFRKKESTNLQLLKSALSHLTTEDSVEEDIKQELPSSLNVEELKQANKIKRKVGRPTNTLIDGKLLLC